MVTDRSFCIRDTISANPLFLARFSYAARRAGPVGAQSCPFDGFDKLTAGKLRAPSLSRGCVPSRARQDRAPTFRLRRSRPRLSVKSVVNALQIGLTAEYANHAEAPSRTDGPAVRPYLGLRELAVGRDRWARRAERTARRSIPTSGCAKESVLLAPVRSTDLFSD